MKHELYSHLCPSRGRHISSCSGSFLFSKKSTVSRVLKFSNSDSSTFYNYFFAILNRDNLMSGKKSDLICKGNALNKFKVVHIGEN